MSLLMLLSRYCSMRSSLGCEASACESPGAPCHCKSMFLSVSRISEMDQRVATDAHIIGTYANEHTSSTDALRMTTAGTLTIQHMQALQACHTAFQRFFTQKYAATTFG